MASFSLQASSPFGGSHEKTGGSRARKETRVRDALSRVLSRPASLAIIEELARRLGIIGVRGGLVNRKHWLLLNWLYNLGR